MATVTNVTPVRPNGKPTLTAAEAANAALLAAQQRIAQLEAKLASKQRVTLKVSEKGAISLYGVGRFPVSLYKSQWEVIIRLVENGELQQFMTTHAAELATKE